MALLNSSGTLDSTSQNAIKGLLILLVVFGHIHAVQFQLRPVYDVLYIFHVAGFLILPFLLPSKPVSRTFLQTRFVRYAAPFFWFFTAATLLFTAVFLLPKGIGAGQVAQNYLLGLATASTRTLDAASGLKLFWFLPTLFTLVALRAVWERYTATRLPILTLGFLTNMFLGELGDTRYYIPWGLSIALYIFPIGLIAAHIFKHSAGPQNAAYRLLLVVLSILSLALAAQTHVSMNLGDVTLYGILSNPTLWAITNLAMGTTVLAIFLLAPLLARIPGLILLGSLSLAIYLTHAFLNQMLEIALPSISHNLSTALLILFPVVLLGATAISLLLTKVEFFRLILFPKDTADLRKWIQNVKSLRK